MTDVTVRDQGVGRNWDESSGSCCVTQVDRPLTRDQLAADLTINAWRMDGRSVGQMNG